MNKFAAWWKKISEDGLRWPYVYDPVSQKPSITIMFPYITFTLALVSVILLHIWPKMILATSVSLMFWATSTIFYMVRKLNKASISLKDQSIELDGEDK